MDRFWLKAVRKNSFVNSSSRTWKKHLSRWRAKRNYDATGYSNFYPPHLFAPAQSAPDDRYALLANDGIIFVGFFDPLPEPDRRSGIQFCHGTAQRPNFLGFF